MNFKLIPIAFISILILGCNNQSYYEKVAELDDCTTLDEKVLRAAHIVPTPQQLEWQKLELTAFIHFGINTFTGREWGDGKESPTLFNPTELDAMQWVRALKDGGMKLVILTAKHHDGFCLWPTKTTNHSVASSPWRNGKGDVVRELRNACDSVGVKFGVYLSPWDRNAESYGDSPRYNEMYRQQLTELLTCYGQVDEVWFDGACAEGPNGKRQEYDWESFYKIIRELQPNAVVAIKGEDVRWVGTETGYGRPTEWSVTAFAPGGRPEMQDINQKLGLTEMTPDLGSRSITAKANKLFWYPAEVDVSIRPGWFYHHEEDNQVKSLDQLADIYFNSIGMNAVLLLNVPPDRRGLIHENDVERLKEFGSWQASTFGENLSSYARLANREHKKLCDTNPETYATLKNLPTSVEFVFENRIKFDIIEVQEYIIKGQRVEEFIVEAITEGTWTEIARGTTIGYKRLLPIQPIETDRVKLTIIQSRHDALISNFGLYLSSSTSQL